MIKLVDVNEPVPYIDVEDKENPTHWNFRRFNFKQEKFVQKITINDNKAFIDRADMYLHLGLMGSDDFEGTLERDEKKKDVYPGIKPWTEETLVQIPFDVRDRMIAFVIGGYAELKDDELKN